MINIVIIDDEIWVTKVISQIIDWKTLGFNIAGIFYDAETAVENILRIQPELVITDIRMPEMTGLELIKKVSGRREDTEFIIVSGYNDFEYAKQALMYGVAGYLLKPIDKQELEKTALRIKQRILQKANQRSARIQLKNNYDQAVEKLQEQYFNNIFEGIGSQEISLCKVNSDLNLNFVEGEYKAIIIALGTYRNASFAIDEIYKAFWKTSLLTLCAEVIAYNSGLNFVILLNYTPGHYCLIKNCVVSMFDRLLQKQFENGITMAVGTTEKSIEGLISSYNAAKLYITARLCWGSNKIFEELDMDEVPKNQKTLLRPNLDMQLKEAFENLDKERISKATEDAVCDLRKRAQKAPLLMMKGFFELFKIYKTNCRDEMSTEQAYAHYFDEKKREIQQLSTVEEILAVFRTIVADQVEKKTAFEIDKIKLIVSDIKKYVDDHYAQDISLEDVSALVGLNQNYVCTVFKKETGTSFIGYLTIKRISVAKMLLKDYRTKISTISEMVGYTDHKYFSKKFKTYVGLTPSEYRRLIVGKEYEKKYKE